MRRGGPVLAYAIALGKVTASPVSRYLMLAYDDLYAIEYFERKERAWWRRNGATAADLVRSARREHDALLERAQRFDTELMADLRKAGGEKYAQLAVLAYRQTLAAHKLVADADGTALYFPKENFSNGCIATVDVIYPSAPFALLFSPRLMKAQLQPVLDYARMDRWRFPFAPHDLGTYPQANGQVYGGGERTEENQMPVEESGNMLILLAALARVEGNADYTARYWPQLTKWAEYLSEKGLDPENQLCTDDFAGHLAHNANLSIKAILALGAYAQLAGMTGHAQDAARYRKIAQEFAGKWSGLAADGDHYKLAFDKPGTWSQKYNLVWDQLLGLNLFPAEIARKEIAFYLTKQNQFGLPLDNRKDYTKLDWMVWTATLAGNAGDFEKIVAPAWQFANDSRQPRAAHRLVRHEDGEAAGLSGAVGSGRAVHQDAGGSGDVEEIQRAVRAFHASREVAREDAKRRRQVHDQARQAFAEDLRGGQQTDYQVGFGFEIVEEAGLHQDVGALQQFERPLLFAVDLRHLQRDVPAAFHRQDIGRRSGQGGAREGEVGGRRARGSGAAPRRPRPAGARRRTAPAC